MRPDSSQLPALMNAVESSSTVKLSGIYSYPARMGRSWSFDTARLVSQEHVSALKDVARLRSKPSSSLILAIGSSITARVIKSVDIDLPSNLTLEIVAGRSIPPHGFHC